MAQTDWYVYLLQCSDNTLYTGVTCDLQRRLHEHNHTSRGARYTRSRRPVTLVYHEQVSDRSSAQQREASIRRMDAAAKRRLYTSGKT